MKMRHLKMARAAYRQNWWVGTRQAWTVRKWHRQFKAVRHV